MGKRGPIKGARNAGRPPGPAQSSSTNGPRRKAKSDSLVAAWAASLKELTFDELREHCGRWRPLEPQDHLLVIVLYDLVVEYSELQAALMKLSCTKRVTVNKSGAEGTKAIVWMRDKARAELLKLGLKFGLSPGDRARMGEKGQDEDDEEDELEAQRKHGEQIAAQRRKAVKNAAPKTRSRTAAVRSREVSGPRTVRKKTSGKAGKTRDRKTAARPEGSEGAET